MNDRAAKKLADLFRMHPGMEDALVGTVTQADPLLVRPDRSSGVEIGPLSFVRSRPAEGARVVVLKTADEWYVAIGDASSCTWPMHQHVFSFGAETHTLIDEYTAAPQTGGFVRWGDFDVIVPARTAALFARSSAWSLSTAEGFEAGMRLARTLNPIGPTFTSDIAYSYYPPFTFTAQQERPFALIAGAGIGWEAPPPYTTLPGWLTNDLDTFDVVDLGLATNNGGQMGDFERAERAGELFQPDYKLRLVWLTNNELTIGISAKVDSIQVDPNIDFEFEVPSGLSAIQFGLTGGEVVDGFRHENPLEGNVGPVFQQAGVAVYAPGDEFVAGVDNNTAFGGPFPVTLEPDDFAGGVVPGGIWTARAFAIRTPGGASFTFNYGCPQSET